jgi:uncharacterized phage protein gp47/JayE
MPFARPTLDELVEQSLGDIDANVDGADARQVASNLSVMGIVTAGHADGLHGHLQLLREDIDWANPDSELVERRAGMVGLYTKAAALAYRIVKFTGTRIEPIDAGTRLKRADGAEYETTEAGVIAAGQALVTVVAVEPGAAGNVATGVKLTLVNGLTGVQSQAEVQAEGQIAGADAESRRQLHGRFMDYWRSTEEGAGPYAKLAKTFPGVTRAWEYENEMGLGTVTVRFVMDGKADTIIPDAAEVASLDAYMQANRPAGMPGLYIVAPIPDPVPLTLAISPDSAQLRIDVEAEIADFHRREVEPGDPTILSRISEVISSVPGEFKHKLTVPADDVSRASNQIAVPGTITWAAY